MCFSELRVTDPLVLMARTLFRSTLDNSFHGNKRRSADSLGGLFRRE